MTRSFQDLVAADERPPGYKRMDASGRDQLTIGPAPENSWEGTGLAASAGVRDALSGIGSLADIATYGAGKLPYVGEHIPQTQWGPAIADYYGDVLGGEHGTYVPQTPWEKLVATGTGAATAFAVPGGLGARYMSAVLPAGRALGSGGLSAARRAYIDKAKEDYLRNAARLGGSNLLGLGAANLAAEHTDNPWYQAAAGAVGGIAGAVASSGAGTAGAIQSCAGAGLNFVKGIC